MYHRREFIDATDEAIGVESTVEELIHPGEVALPNLRKAHEGTHHQSPEPGKDLAVGVFEHLVHAMGNELKGPFISIVVESVVIGLHRISIPIPGHDIQCGMRQQQVHVQVRLNSCKKLGQISLVERSNQGLLGRVILRGIPVVNAEFLVNVIEKTSIVEIA